jgi:acetyltransferase-like isoleucine patch superfamily enzyme
MKSVKRLFQTILASLYDFLRRQEEARALHDLVDRGLLVMGRHTYGIPTVHTYRGSERKAVIGAFCSISPGVTIITGGIHPQDWVSLYPFRINWKMEGAFADGMPYSRGDVAIGCDVWLGTDAMVLSGVTIGHGSIVAARSVVTRDVPPYAIVAGCPARVVRYRFPPEMIDQLLRIAWWNWDDARIREAVPLLCDSDVERFVKQYGEVGK